MGHLRRQDGLDALASFSRPIKCVEVIVGFGSQDSEAEMELVMQGIYQGSSQTQREARLARRSRADMPQ